MIRPSRELSLTLYEMGRPLNLSVNDLMIFLAPGLKAAEAEHEARRSATVENSPGRTSDQPSDEA